jgi:4-diphosphocytidyl-2-C-methyl-D-erythritol kinase
MVSVPAPAKVNLSLRVLDREESGYHQLETLFLALEFGDTLRLSTARDGITLSVQGADVGPVEDNLVYRAAAGFLTRAGIPTGVGIHLEKRIPVTGGLGGGSSDAAATLKGLQELFPGRLSPSAMVRLAGELGADVPFFLSPSTLALAWRRGDRLLPLPPLPSAPVVLAFPPVGVETPKAFDLLDRFREENPTPHSASVLPFNPFSEWETVERFAVNDFEDVVLPAFPSLSRILGAMRSTGPRVALLAGSGSTLFAVYSSEKEAQSAARGLTGEFPNARFQLTRTLEAVPGPSQDTGG